MCFLLFHRVSFCYYNHELSEKIRFSHLKVCDTKWLERFEIAFV